MALVAVSISMQSLNTSQRAVETAEKSMKVGQRAYVHIANGKASVPVNFNGPNPPNGHPNLAVLIEFEIHNLGNTPADINEVQVSVEPPEGWKPSADTPAREKTEYTSIPAKTFSRYYSTREYQVLPEQYKRLRIDGPIVDADPTIQPVIRGYVDYTDVFGDKYRAAWCWVVRPLDDPDQCK